MHDPDFDPDSSNFQESLRRLITANFEPEFEGDDADEVVQEVQDFSEKIKRWDRTAIPKITEGKIFWVPLAYDIAANWNGDFRLPVAESFLKRKQRRGQECITRFRDPRIKDPATVSPKIGMMNISEILGFEELECIHLLFICLVSVKYGNASNCVVS